jgi:transcriptional regulator NrdR family protein
MPCNQCGSVEVHVKDSTGGIKEGRFREKHECENCGAVGTVKGNAEEPAHTWTRYGSVF